MTIDIQFVYLRRGGHNYRVSHTMIDMTFVGRIGDVIWWWQDGEVAFELVDILYVSRPQWIECSEDERGYKTGLYDNGLPLYVRRDSE